MSDPKTEHLVNRLREVFQERRYGGDAEYHPDFDLFDAAADEIDRLRATEVVAKYWQDQFNKLHDHMQRVRSALDNSDRAVRP